MQLRGAQGRECGLQACPAHLRDKEAGARGQGPDGTGTTGPTRGCLPLRARRHRQGRVPSGTQASGPVHGRAARGHRQCRWVCLASSPKLAAPLSAVLAPRAGPRGPVEAALCRGRGWVAGLACVCWASSLPLPGLLLLERRALPLPPFLARSLARFYCQHPVSTLSSANTPGHTSSGSSWPRWFLLVSQLRESPPP